MQKAGNCLFETVGFERPLGALSGDLKNGGDAGRRFDVVVGLVGLAARNGGNGVGEVMGLFHGGGDLRVWESGRAFTCRTFSQGFSCSGRRNGV